MVDSSLRRRTLLFSLAAVKTTLFLVVVVCAASISITNISFSGEQGTLVTVANGLLSVDKGFNKTTVTLSAAGTSCPSTVVFGASPGTANTGLTANDVIYDVQVNTTGSAPSNSCFTVRLAVTLGLGTPTNYGPVYIETGSPVTGGRAIDCKFDLQTTSLPT